MPDDRDQFEKVVDTVKPYLEQLADKIGGLLVNNSLVKPLLNQMDVDFRKALGEGFKPLGGYANFPKSWFKTEAMHHLANELLDELFKGAGEAIKKTEAVEDPIQALRYEMRGVYNSAIKGLDMPVALDRDGLHFHFPKCNFAPRGRGKKGEQDLCSRFDAMLMGRVPKHCCAGWFNYHDAKAKFEAPGNLDRALSEIRDAGDRREAGGGNADVEMFMDWLTSLSREQRWEIKPWLDSIERGDHVQLILRMIRRHNKEFEYAQQHPSESVLNLQADERSGALEEDLEQLAHSQWLEMRAWIQASLPRKHHKFFTMENARVLYGQGREVLHRNDERIGQVADVGNKHAESLIDKLKARRDAAYRRVGREIPQD